VQQQRSDEEVNRRMDMTVSRVDMLQTHMMEVEDSIQVRHKQTI
jgi:hypothetical protein